MILPRRLGTLSLVGSVSSSLAAGRQAGLLVVGWRCELVSRLLHFAGASRHRFTSRSPVLSAAKKATDAFSPRGRFDCCADLGRGLTRSGKPRSRSTDTMSRSEPPNNGLQLTRPSLRSGPRS
jgi:hypothetical protein